MLGKNLVRAEYRSVVNPLLKKSQSGKGEEKGKQRKQGKDTPTKLDLGYLSSIRSTLDNFDIVPGQTASDGSAQTTYSSTDNDNLVHDVRVVFLDVSKSLYLQLRAGISRDFLLWFEYV